MIGMRPRSTIKRVKIPVDDMSGGRLLIDRPITIRGIAHAVNSDPSAIINTISQLKDAGMKKSRPVKGSQEARDHMARIRAMRKINKIKLIYINVI